MIENGCKKITSPTNVLSFGQFEYIFQNYYQYHKDCGAAWVATLVLRVWQNCCWLVSAFQKVWFWNFSMGSAGELICCAKLDPTQSNASPIKSDRRKKWRRKKCSHFWPNFCHFCTKKLFSSGLNKNISKPHFLECTNQPRTKNKFWALTILSNLCTSSRPMCGLFRASDGALANKIMTIVGTIFLLQEMKINDACMPISFNICFWKGVVWKQVKVMINI